ncbi:MAG: hypothetical protein SynsKO_03310 [Synoicihabitans sp.]
MYGSKRPKTHSIWWLPTLLAVGFSILHLTLPRAFHPATLPTSKAPEQGALMPREETPTARLPAPPDEKALRNLNQLIIDLRERIHQREISLQKLSERSNDRRHNPRNLELEFVPASAWENRGSDSPAHLLETTLHAAAGGDTQLLRSLLHMDEETQAFARALFAVIPADLQRDIGTVESFVAMMTVDAIPHHEHRISGIFPDGPSEAVVVLQRKPENQGARKLMNLTVKQETTGEPWKLMVPPQAIERYYEKLLGPLSETESMP